MDEQWVILYRRPRQEVSVWAWIGHAWRTVAHPDIWKGTYAEAEEVVNARWQSTFTQTRILIVPYEEAVILYG